MSLLTEAKMPSLKDKIKAQAEAVEEVVEKKVVKSKKKK